MKVNYISSWNSVVKSLVFLILINTVSTSAQQASAFQSGHYYPGIMNVRDMAQPPSGLFILWYNFASSSNKYIDQNGNEFETIPLSQIDPSLPDINVETKLNGFGSAPVIAWASSKISFLGNARYIAGIGPNYISADVSLITEGAGNVSNFISDTELSTRVSGFADLMIIPFGLSWGTKTMDFTTSYTIYAPTGRYKSGAADNIGLGYWTHQFQGFGYFYPVEDKSSALMMGLTFETNSQVKDSDLKPGNRFTLEYGISQFLSQKFEVGISGAHNWQVSKDSGSDVFWNTENFDRKSSLFFNASYWPIAERLMFSLKYGFDYGIRQRFKNNMFVFNVLFNPNLLTSKG